MSNVKAVDQGIPYGVYTWRINGRTVVNENREHLIAPARKGDLRAIKRLKDFVNNVLDIHEGEAVFVEGARPVSQEEWEDQMARLQNGQVPDPYDLGSLIEDYKFQKELDK